MYSKQLFLSKDCGEVHRAQLRWERRAFIRDERQFDWSRTKGATWYRSTAGEKFIHTCALLRSPDGHFGHNAGVDEERHSKSERTRASKTLDCLDKCDMINNKISFLPRSRATLYSASSVLIGFHRSLRFRLTAVGLGVVKLSLDIDLNHQALSDWSQLTRQLMIAVSDSIDIHYVVTFQITHSHQLNTSVNDKESWKWDLSEPLMLIEKIHGRRVPRAERIGRRVDVTEPAKCSFKRLASNLQTLNTINYLTVI